MLKYLTMRGKTMSRGRVGAFTAIESLSACSSALVGESQPCYYKEVEETMLWFFWRNR
jgi:hypothetical protein